MMISGVSQGSVLVSLSLLYISDLLFILDNTLVDIADSSTFLADVLEPGVRVPAVSPLNSDITRIGDWCMRLEMLVHIKQTKN